jgi:hypothetical protein
MVRQDEMTKANKPARSFSATTNASSVIIGFEIRD